MGGLGPLHPWTWGNISYTISVPEATPAVIVLRQLDTRYFRDISCSLLYTMEFVLFRKGSNEPLAVSPRAHAIDRSQSVEVDLKAGEYVVHVRLDSLVRRDVDYFEKQMSNWDAQVLKRVLAQRAIAYSKASNSTSEWNDTIPTSLRSLAGQDLTSLEILKVEKKRREQAKRMEELAGQEYEEGGEEEEGGDEYEEEANEEGDAEAKAEAEDDNQVVHQGISCDNCGASPISGTRYSCNSEEHPNYDLCQDCFGDCDHDPEHEMIIIPVPRGEKPVHKGIYCSDCGYIVKGTQYNCLSEDCEDANLCEECFGKGEHDQTHEMWMMPLPQSSTEDDDGVGFETDRPVHPGIQCNSCGMVPVVGPRFKCMDPKCTEYDLCEDCFARGVHPSDHRMLRLDDPNEALHLNPAAAAEGSTLVLGLRVNTRKGAAAVLGGQLKHGSLK